MDNLNIYDNKFYLFNGGDKSKLLIDDDNKIEELENINEFDYTVIKSILNNINLDKTNIKKDIKLKFDKLKNLLKDGDDLKKINTKEFMSKLEEFDDSGKFNEDKKEVISNIFDFNQSGGGLLYYFGDLLEKGSKAKEAVKKTTFQKFLKGLFFGYNSILGIIDFLLDVTILSNNSDLLELDRNKLNIANIVYSFLNYDGIGICSALLGLIPEYGDLAASSSGLAINLYRLSLFMNKKYKTNEELEYEKIENIENGLESDTFVLKDKYIPKPGTSYNQSFYERIKFL